LPFLYLLILPVNRIEKLTKHLSLFLIRGFLPDNQILNPPESSTPRHKRIQSTNKPFDVTDEPFQVTDKQSNAAAKPIHPINKSSPPTAKSPAATANRINAPHTQFSPLDKLKAI
jgi:hypothetical protein